MVYGTPERIPNIWNLNLFGPKNFFGPKTFWSQKCFGSQILLTKYFGPKFWYFYLGIECGPTQSYLFQFLILQCFVEFSIMTPFKKWQLGQNCTKKMVRPYTGFCVGRKKTLEEVLETQSPCTTFDIVLTFKTKLCVFLWNDLPWLTIPSHDKMLELNIQCTPWFHNAYFK